MSKEGVKRTFRFLTKLHKGLCDALEKSEEKPGKLEEKNFVTTGDVRYAKF